MAGWLLILAWLITLQRPNEVFVQQTLLVLHHAECDLAGQHRILFALNAYQVGVEERLKAAIQLQASNTIRIIALLK
ncbi:hypothetical protein D3C71_1985130 [compost metagenome]